MASTDAFVDQIRAFRGRVEKIAASRKEANNRERERIKKLIDEYDQSLSPDAHLGAPADFDPEIAKKILETLDHEEELLTEAIDLANRAEIVTQRSSDDTVKGGGFDRLIELLLAAVRLEGEASAGEAVAERLRSLAELGSGAHEQSDALADRLIALEWRVQSVQVDHAQAAALETRARARVARARADQARDRLSVSIQDALGAEEDQRRVATEVQETKASLAEEKRKLKRPPVATEGLDAETAREARETERASVLAQFDLLDRRSDAEDALMARATARAVAMRALAHHKAPEWPPKVSPERVAALIATVDQQRTSIDTELARLREAEDKLGPMSILRRMYRARRQTLDETLGVLRETRESYSAVQIIQTACERVARPEVAGLSVWAPVAMTLLVLLLAGLLLTIGLKQIYHLIDAESGKLKLPPRYAGQIRTAVALLWPLLVFSCSAAVLVWPIWGFDVTLGEAIRAIDHPIFYVDEKPVSIFSVVELCFAIWASVVASKAIRDFLSARIYKNLGWDIGLTNALNTLVHYVVVLIGIIVGVRFVGIGASSLAILFGILGIGIGFGLRNIAENFISGLIILAERPIKIGDFVEIDGTVEGQIQAISARSTTVVTRDNVSLIIPNSEFVGQRVTNWSHGDPKVRIHVSVGVAYGSDTDLVRRTLLEASKKHGQVLKKPAPEVQFLSFGASSLDFDLLVWIEEQQHRFRIASDLHFAIDAAFRKVGIEIAFPQMDLHLRSVTENLAKVLHPDVAAAPADGPLKLPDGRQRGSVPHKPA